VPPVTLFVQRLALVLAIPTAIFILIVAVARMA
jgi:hypothetical protein